MCKRIPAALCAAVLLLSACSHTGSPASDTNAETAAASSAAAVTDVSEPASERPCAPVTEAPEPEPVETAPAPTAPENPVAAGRIRVYTDDSRYSAWQPPAALYTRPEGRDLSVFHPENANGRIYPYYAAGLYEGNYRIGFHTGFVDSSWTLVTDSVYTQVDVLSKNTETGYHAGDSSFLPLWRITRVEIVTLQNYGSEESPALYPEGDVLFGIAAMDGSFSLPCVYYIIDFYEDRIICYRESGEEGEQRECEVYDLHGRLRTTSQALRAATGFENFWVKYGEGYYLVYDPWNGGACFCSEDGTAVLGPYRAAEPFREGVAAVCREADGLYGFIDSSGSWVIEPEYASALSFDSGLAHVKLPGTSGRVIDRSGKTVLSVPRGASVSVKPYGIVIRETHYESLYDRSGVQLTPPRSKWSVYDNRLLCLYTDDGVLVRDLETGVETDLPETTRLEFGVYHVGDGLQRCFMARETDGHLYYYPEDLSERVDLGPEEALDWEFTRMYNPEIDEVTLKEYYLLNDNGICSFYDENAELLGTMPGNAPCLIDGMVFDTDSFACTYRSLAGELLFSFPLLGVED